MIESEQENKDATQDNESNDSGDDSDEDDSDYVEPNERRGKIRIFEEEEESDDSGTQNTLGKEPGEKEMVPIETIVENAIDNDATESGKRKTLETNDKSETDPAGSNKRAGESHLEEEKRKRLKKSSTKKK
jgi:hypothetical protein